MIVVPTERAKIAPSRISSFVFVACASGEAFLEGAARELIELLGGHTDGIGLLGELPVGDVALRAGVRRERVGGDRVGREDPNRGVRRLPLCVCVAHERELLALVVGRQCVGQGGARRLIGGEKTRDDR